MTELNVRRQEKVNCNDQFLLDILEGLSQVPQKTLPCKYFYDEKGAYLFDQICLTPEYYPTRTELKILDEVLPHVANLVGPGADILEFGSGAGIKIRKLLQALISPRSYCPIDISEEILLSSSAQLQRQFPHIVIHPIVADYHAHIHLPDEFSHQDHNRTLVFFPGSTISNFEPQDAIHFLKHIRGLLKPGDAMLIGVDLVKPLPRLIAAYNDSAGMTAAFNLNILDRIQSNYRTDLQLENFAHRARYNPEKRRIEMHLVSKKRQSVSIESAEFQFEAGETIHTENSYKYSIESFRLMATNAGFRCVETFTDAENLFSVHYLEAK